MEEEKNRYWTPEYSRARRRNWLFPVWLLILGATIGVLLTNTYRARLADTSLGINPVSEQRGESSLPEYSTSDTGEPLPPTTGAGGAESPSAMADYESTVIAATRKAIPAVVAIYTSGRQVVRFREPLLDMMYGPQTRSIGATGSGVIIDPKGTIITNEHVVSSVKRTTNAVIRVDLPDGRSFDATVVRELPGQDIAILSIDGKNLPYLEMDPSAMLVQGQTVLAIGNPFGFSTNGQPTVTRGVVSATKRNLTVGDENDVQYLHNMIQTDASINEGNSGGALIDLNGRLVGINTAIFSPDGSGSVGIGFAIPSDRIKALMESIRTFGKGGDIKSGISILPLDSAMAGALSFPGEHGVVIKDVESGSPGARAGFRKDDIITEINGFSANSVEKARAIFRGAFPGEIYELKIFRKGEVKTLQLTIGVGA